MTGPGPGKIRLEAEVKVFLSQKGLINVDAEVYLHVKGWSRARVTHLDVEAQGLTRLLELKVGEGVYGGIEGIGCGLRFVPFKRPWRILVCEHNVIPKAIGPGDKVNGYLGTKEGGVYIGMERRVLRILEEIAAKEYRTPPKRRVF